MAQHFEPRQRVTVNPSLPSKLATSSSLLQQTTQYAGNNNNTQHQSSQQQYPQYRYTQQQQQYSTPSPSNYPAPQLLQYEPQHGPEGVSVTVSLQISYPEKQLKLSFGSLVVDTRQFNGPEYTTLNAVVPQFSLTKSNVTKVSVDLLVFDDEIVADRFPIGDFTYDTTMIKNGRKRSVESSCSYETDLYSPKRVNIDNMVRPKEEDNYMIHPNNYQSYYRTSPVMASPYASAIQMQQQQQQRGFFGDVSSMYGYNTPATSHYMYATSAATSVATQGISGLGLTIADLSPNAALNANVAHLSTTPVSSAYMPHTSPSESSPISNSATGDISPIMPSTPSYTNNPYASLLNKANLKIQGTMEEMASSWTPEEWESRRRLVQFWRRQEGNDIICTFAPVAASERQPNSIVVSCIYWQEKNDCFITSVDTIMLLESLIGVRFTVEEKNRIRRNLEGFRPITVSKCKPESAEFFKLIMSFPNPKPRNIEKDVKVFPWTVLPYALKKIISKYTASYSSTASVNVDALQNTAYPTSMPHGSDPYDAAIDNTSSSPLPTSSHVVASQTSLSSQQQQSGRTYGQTHHHQQQQQQPSSAYDTLTYGNSSHSHNHHSTAQYSYGYRNLPYTATTEQIGYDETSFHSAASSTHDGSSHVSTPHTLQSWGGADE